MNLHDMTDLVIALCQERKGSYPYLHRLEPHMTRVLVKRIITGVKQTRTLVYIVNQPEHVTVILYNTFCFPFIHVCFSPEIKKGLQSCFKIGPKPKFRTQSLINELLVPKK